MAKPTRFTQDMYEEYFSNGLWTMDTTTDLWDQNSERYPDKEAFVDVKRRLTWTQIKLMSDRLAFNLLGLGLKRDEFIFSLLPNHAESYIMRAACEKAGLLCGSALMTIRQMEIEFVLKTFEAVGIAIPIEFRGLNYYEAVLEMLPRLPKLKHIFIEGETIPPGSLSIEDMMEQPQVVPSDAFRKTRIKATEISIIGFTSGTTGMPKGSEHVQCARIAMARAYGVCPKIEEKDIVLNIISPVGGLSSAFCYNSSAALVGAKVVLLDIWSPEKAFELIEKERVTILLAVPAQLAKIVRSDCQNYDLSSLRCICTSTAPLPYTLARDVEEKFKVPLLNIYGQFDAGLIAGVSIDDSSEVRRSTVGKITKGTIISLVDEEGKEVPVGREGEIIYTGPSAASGYFKDLETTMKVWGCLGKEGRCRSGDLGKFDADGNLVLLGRKKDVIIRGGQNIYPAEIEGLLLTSQKIESAAVVPMPDPIMGEKACAYVTLRPSARFTFAEMIEFLKNKKIANYKLPERLEIRERLPISENQKIAKASLREDIIHKMKEEGKL
jgi:non-ribosomal peptide synthetase component E (peptide arylation enzyme)